MTNQPITEPCIWIANDAEEAIRFYTDLIPDSEIYSLNVMADPQGGSTVVSSFRLGGVNYRAIGAAAQFALNESFSISVSCADQTEVDRYWDALSEGGEEGNCGWLRDRWGLSWQIVPVQLGRLMGDPNRARAGAATQAMLGMKRLVIAELEAAANAAG